MGPLNARQTNESSGLPRSGDCATLAGMDDVLIILPTYNERENLEKMVAAIGRELPGAHLLIIDDGSPDGTGDIADTIAAADPSVFVHHREGKLGLGTAYMFGFRWALERDYRHVFEMDCDFSHDPADLPRLLDESRLVFAATAFERIRF
jgi:dolichol-phosphate mannosyltransferase